MSQDPELDVEDPIDPVALARLFVSGRSIKRGATIQMVRELLMLLDTSGRLDIPPDVVKEETLRDDHLKVVPLAKPPIKVHAGLAGSIFLGPEANRHYTRNEALALASTIQAECGGIEPGRFRGTSG